MHTSKLNRYQRNLRSFRMNGQQKITYYIISLTSFVDVCGLINIFQCGLFFLPQKFRNNVPVQTVVFAVRLLQRYLHNSLIS